ncbi:MAG: metalloregulator ArsR/SmtB family transcription factor [Gammaproteobacteria bacterium]|nr:metalloregulator ArsR/SmtB family transcription factor [Gammaproteobacteria bacterium]
MIKPEIFFTLLSDETRLRCLFLLQEKGELCVCDLIDALKMIQPKISRHLALLRKYKVVTATRRGTWMYYHISNDLPDWAKKTLSFFAEMNQKDKPFSSDLKNLGKTCSSC